MKKLTALLLAVLMVFVFSACQPAASTAPETEEPAPAEEQPAAPEEPAGEEEPETSGGSVRAEDLTTLYVSPGAQMNGDFISDFGSNAYDGYVRDLLWGDVATVAQTPAGEYVINETVVADYTTETDDAGNKTYTFTLNDGLLWSDGEPITAQDFVFEALMSASPEYVTAGASSTAGDYLLGYSAYHDGSAETFEGVKLIDDKTFSLTIAAEQLPYFYEYVMVRHGPYPMHYYCPAATIESTDAGAKIVDDDLEAELQNVAQTIRFAPEVTPGPYKFVSFENQIATVTINENFCGTYEGKQPQIQNVVCQYTPGETEHQALIAGDLDLLPNAAEAYKVDAIKASENCKTLGYLRAGFGIINFSCDWGPTTDPNVRWALAYLIDRNEVINYAFGGYGGIVNGPYAYAQWMYEEAGDELDELLVPFNLNVDKANEYLDQSEWKYESDGVTPFDATKATADGTYLRYNAEGEPLTIHHVGSADTVVTDVIEIQYVANAPLAGVDYQVTKGDFDMLLDNYYYGYEMSDEDRYYCSFNMGWNIEPAYDPYYSYHSDWLNTSNNALQISDPELDELMIKLRQTEPGDNDAFIDTWLQFEKRFQELMPCIPLYCNEYTTCAYETVFGIEAITPYANWSNVICDLYKAAA